MSVQPGSIRARTLRAIVRLTNMYGYPPTIRELADAIGIVSTGHMSYYLGVLEREGAIERDRRRSRGLRVVGVDQPLCPRCAVLEAEVAALRALLAEREDMYAS